MDKLLNQPAIVVKELTKHYDARNIAKSGKKGVLAIDNLSFEVQEGELCGLLGPNGAGKTTTIKVLSTLLIPDHGDAFVLRRSCVSEPERVRPIIGVITGGERGLYYRLTGRENLLFFARLYNLPDGPSRKRTEALLELVGLQERGDDRVERYSRGMKQRLHIARGLIHDPPVLLMDEPTIGLDPNSALSIRTFIKDELQKKLGKTILLTTHYMSEAERLCDRVAILNQGRLVTLGTPIELKRLVPKDESATLVVRVFSSVFEKQVREISGIDVVGIEAEAGGGSRVTCKVDGSDEVLPKVIEIALNSESKIISVLRNEPTLEDAFINLTSREMEE